MYIAVIIFCFHKLTKPKDQIIGCLQLYSIFVLSVYGGEEGGSRIRIKIEKTNLTNSCLIACLKHINAIVLIIFNLKNAHFVFQANKVGKIKYISYIYLNLKYFF